MILPRAPSEKCVNGATMVKSLENMEIIESRSLARSQLIQWSVPMLYAKQAACCMVETMFFSQLKLLGGM